RYKAFGRGSLEFLYPDNHRVLAFVRRHQDETILVVANLSRFPQHAAVDLSAYKGSTLTELFGRTQFPAVADAPYTLMLGPHSFYWFALTAQAAPISVSSAKGNENETLVEVNSEWSKAFSGRARITLEEALPKYLMARRWFQGKARQIKSVSFVEIVPAGDSIEACLIQVQVEYTEEDPEVYMLPLAFATGERADQLRQTSPTAILARVSIRGEGGQTGVIYDAVLDKQFCIGLVDMIARRRHVKGSSGEFSDSYMRILRKDLGTRVTNLEVSSMKAEQTNSSIVFGDRYILKMFRRLETGVNPEMELGRFLTQQAHFTHTPA